MFEAARQPILLVGPKHTVSLNTKAAALFGAAGGAQGGLPLTDLIPDRQPDGHESRRLMAWRARAACEGWPQEFEWRFRRLDGAFFDSRVDMARADWESPQALELIVSSPRGPWEASRLEELAQRSHTQEAVARLAGGVAHDFNNLLTSIIGHAQLLEARQLAMEERDELHQIESAAERAAQIVLKLLAFSMQQPMAVRRVDLNDLIAGMLDQLKDLLGRGISITTRLSPNLGTVTVDPSQLEEALLAIAFNARQAMPSGGSLDIETCNLVAEPFAFPGLPETPAGTWTVLSIRDNGSGMDEAALSRLFEPYFTSRPCAIGVGLGLAAVYGLVRQNGGHVEARSRPGRGTTVTIYLQRAYAALGAPFPPAAPLSEWPPQPR